MDITSWIEDLKGIKQVQFNFHKYQSQVEIKIEDRKYTLSRAYRNNKFATTGSRLLLDSLEDGIIRYKSFQCMYTCLFNLNPFRNKTQVLKGSFCDFFDSTLRVALNTRITVNLNYDKSKIVFQKYKNDRFWEIRIVWE